MCVMSMVTAGMGQQWPEPKFWPKQDLIDVAEILKRLDALDKKLGAPNCHEPIKEEFIKSLEQRIAKLEGKEKRSRKKVKAR